MVKEYLTVNETSELLRISQTTVYNLKKKYPGLYTKFGGRVLIDADALNDLLAGNKDRMKKKE